MPKCKSQGAPGDSVRVSTRKSEMQWCSLCRMPTCLALVRFAESPQGWADVISRILLLACSGHWRWRTTLRIYAAFGASAVPMVATLLARSAGCE